jgi:sec-independent protein translocase protein TatA
MPLFAFIPKPSYLYVFKAGKTNPDKNFFSPSLNEPVMSILLLFIFGQGPWEIFIIFFVVLLLFGGKKIPELMRGIGKGIREFNAARSSIEQEIKDGMRENDRKELEEKKQGNFIQRS